MRRFLRNTVSRDLYFGSACSGDEGRSPYNHHSVLSFYINFDKSCTYLFLV